MALDLSTKGLAQTAARHPWRVIAAWIVGLVGSFVLIGALLPTAVTNEATVTSKPESERGAVLLEERLRGPEPINEALVIRSQTLTVDSPAYRSYVEFMASEIAALGPDKVSGTTS